MAKKDISFTPHQMELASKLTPLQRKFIIELIRPNTSKRQAYIAAGGKANGEVSQDASAYRMFKNVQVRAFYDAIMEAKTVNSIMEREEALEILSNNARVKMTDVADFSRIEVGKDENDNPIMQTVWQMKDSNDIDPSVLSCIKSVTMTKAGPKIELHDQQGAIKQLTDMQGWSAPKKTELTGSGGEAINLNTNVSAPEIAAALSGLMDKL